MKQTIKSQGKRKKSVDEVKDSFMILASPGLLKFEFLVESLINRPFQPASK